MCVWSPTSEKHLANESLGPPEVDLAEWKGSGKVSFNTVSSRADLEHDSVPIIIVTGVLARYKIRFSQSWTDNDLC